MTPQPSESRRLLDLVFELCEQNSQTFNCIGVDHAGRIAARELEALGGIVERLQVQPATEVARTGELIPRPLGHAVRACFNCNRPAPSSLPRILLSIHLDTVHLPESPFTARLEADTLIGPGVVDAKGGLVVLLEALRLFLNSDAAHKLAIEVLLNPDEEIGSPGSLGLLRESARRCLASSAGAAGLVFEPSLPDGALVGARKGSGNYTFVVRGRSAHAGRDFALGRNALNAAADLTLRLEALNGQLPGVILNPGVLDAGTATNVVPEVAVLRVNVRADSSEAAAALDAAIRTTVAAVAQSRDGITVSLHGGLTSPPRPISPLNGPLYDIALRAGESLGLALTWRDSGGACDGNKLAAAGLPVLDSLGPTGGNLHSDREYLLLPSLPERARLTAAILHQLARRPA